MKSRVTTTVLVCFFSPIRAAAAALSDVPRFFDSAYRSKQKSSAQSATTTDRDEHGIEVGTERGPCYGFLPNFSGREEIGNENGTDDELNDEILEANKGRRNERHVASS
jgi:hypothetical protein